MMVKWITMKPASVLVSAYLLLLIGLSSAGVIARGHAKAEPLSGPSDLGVAGSSREIIPTVTHIGINDIDTIEHAVVWLGPKKVGVALLMDNDDFPLRVILVPLRAWAAAFGDVKITYVAKSMYEGEPEPAYYIGWKSIDRTFIYQGVGYAPLEDLMKQAGLESTEIDGKDVYVECYQ